MTSAVWMPQGPGRIAHDVPMPVAAWLGTYPAMDAASPNLWVPTGAPLDVVRPWGVGRRHDAIGKYVQRLDIRQARSVFSVVAVFSPTVAGTTRVIASMGGSGAGQGWSAGMEAANKLQITFGGVATYTSAGAALSNNVAYTAGWVCRGNGVASGARFFLNGVLDGTATPGTMGTVNSQPLTIGAAHNNVAFTAAATCDIGTVVVFDSALPDEVMQAYTANPWQIFEGPFRAARPDTSAGAATGQGVLLGQFRNRSVRHG